MARRREFDEDALLEMCIPLFWEKGFQGTSMTDVAVATGVGNGSIYAAYGSKAGLFLVVLERYCATRVELVRVAMRGEGSTVDAVRGFFETIVDDCARHRPSWGCLMLTSMAELGRQWPEVADLTLRTVREMQDVVIERLRRASPHESASSRRDLAATIVLASQAILQASLLEPEPVRLRRFALSSVERLAPRLAA
ncbi:TetR/AcrR family transcriptional regulator [Cnuibacter physcomitrellae]|uniref:TetR/AcrR family transcriptional regulator n=1 Tax=Cnuibacter physcomitrellae TaxID=1619308 RepID=UPI002175AD36|nr:TetR/AcrR family transcriptional regulator [Cnuibacter physcomitrellae]MCS5497711.1 TetR/AcrR family transcriptional regulator [Cnuibacter physcomitrellae]